MKDTDTLTFCQDYVLSAGQITGLVWWFLIAALVLGLAFGIVELIRKFQEPRSRSVRGVAPSTLKDLIDALKGFIEALSKAPAWIALFGIGLLLFWAAGNSIPDECKAEMNKTYASAKQKDGQATATANSATSLPYEGDNRAIYSGDGQPDGK